MVYVKCVMAEMGIQMELKRRDSGLMHRAITRKPRVDVNSKHRRYSSKNSEDSHMEDSEKEELGNINIDVSFSIEDVKYAQNTPFRQPNRSSRRRKYEDLIDGRQAINGSEYSDPKDSGEKMNGSIHITDSSSSSKNAQSRPRPKVGLVRTMSVDNVLHRRRPTRDPSFFLKPTSPDGKVKFPDYDAGSQIMESYSEKLQYSAGTPRLSKGKRVRSFFRRLAGSLESLLGIKRKSDTFGSQDFTTPSPPARSTPSQDFHTPYAVPKERQSTKVTSSFEATMSAQSYDRVSGSVDASSIKDTQRNVPKSDFAFHRGNRIYTPRDTTVPSMASALITPTPPRKPATKRSRGLRKNKFRRRHHIRRGSSAEFSDISNDWETRSDTDSEGYAFQSNRLTMMSDSFQSNYEDVDQLDNESQNSNLDLRPQECELATTTQVLTKRSIPVKISEFRPPGNSIKQIRTNESNPTKGPMKAIRPTAEITMPRSESTGKFDISKRQVKRKVRRRNSSFVPNKGDRPELRTVDAVLKEAMSFEKIMSDINDLADSLDKASMSSIAKLAGSETSRPDELGTSSTAKVATTTQKQSSSQLSRNQSWVGKVSHRLDNLIEAKDDSDSKITNNSKENLRSARSKPPTPKTNRKRAPGKDRKPRAIIKEKVSFDELENDFKNFARQVRERKISTEKVNTVGT